MSTGEQVNIYRKRYRAMKALHDLRRLILLGSWSFDSDQFG